MKKITNIVFISAFLIVVSCQGEDPAAIVNNADDFTNLTFSEEFNTVGAPDPAVWVYDLGTGEGTPAGLGWGNNEKQNYTKDSKNIRVEDGSLIITAIKETSGNQSYSSARIKTQGKYNFKYGKIEIKAKLPTGLGTWAAIWSLGSNFSTVKWPNCGEIEFMEHVGKEQNKILGSLHYPGHSGGSSVTGSKIISNASTEFHIYKVIWNSNSIRFFVDDILYQTAPNASAFPFNQDFFIILNVAMGGDLGGIIDSTFTQSSMFIDYIRVYQ